MANQFSYQVRKYEELKSFPVEHGNLVIKGANKQAGWIIQNQKCGYEIDYNPEAEEPQYKITITNSKYEGLLDGYCGNKDQIRINDEFKASKLLYVDKLDKL